MLLPLKEINFPFCSFITSTIKKMADDGEWHTVTSNKHVHIPAAAASATKTTPASSNPSKSRRKSRPNINVPKQQQKQQQHHHSKDNKSSIKKPSNFTASSTKSTTAKANNRSLGHDSSVSLSNNNNNNPFHAAADDSDSDEEEEDGQVDPIDIPVPPYHTTIVVSCPLNDCDSPIPFMDTTSLVKHLKGEHKLMFKNLHHMYMALDAYLARWAKELELKPITEYAHLEPLDNNESNVYLSLLSRI